jgi:ATP-dependent DNA helicase RecQ
MIDESPGDLAHRRRLSQHLDAMLALCETVQCRRQNLLGYFGETSEPCGNCDTCLEPPAAWDGTVPAQKLMSTIVRLQRERRQRFGAGHLIDILRGKQTARVQQYGHDSLATWNIGDDLSEHQWRGVARQLLAQGLLATQGEYGTLTVTDAASDVLSGRRTVMLRTEPERAPRSRGVKAAPAAADLEPVQAELFEALRAWRAGEAREQGVPAYIVFGDATLRAVAVARPERLTDLDGITGIGAKKLEAYGDALLAVVARA